MNKTKDLFQIVWGAALLIMGVAFLFQIPQVIPRVAQIEQYSNSIVLIIIRFCMYLVAVLLIGGGGRKLYLNFKTDETREENSIGD
jgi:hypothetical protein